MNIVITGARGFIGKNLALQLQQRSGVTVLGFDQEQSLEELRAALAQADWVYHLAGVNRPQSEEEYFAGNVGFTAQVCNMLKATGRRVPIVFSSSIQAELDNPYGLSKREAEEVIRRYADEAQTAGIIYRLKNVFGKWCRPNYNSVVATFCHNIARDLPVTISDPNKELVLVHVDDVVKHFIDELESMPEPGVYYREVSPVFKITLGELADTLRSFRSMRDTLFLPDFSDPFLRKLYGTYVSYLEPDQFAYSLQQHCDARGCLAEFLKSQTLGQIFVSSTRPEVTRGNHYHHTKVEKFLVLYGEALIRFRPVLGGEVIEYYVRGEDFRVVDIPPGYTHSITNVGNTDLITLFWADEVFEKEKADTFYLEV